MKDAATAATAAAARWSRCFGGVRCRRVKKYLWAASCYTAAGRPLSWWTPGQGSSASRAAVTAPVASQQRQAAWHSCSNYTSESVRQVHDVFMRGLVGQRELATVVLGQREDADASACTAPPLPSKSTPPVLNACYARLSRSHVLSALITYCSSYDALSVSYDYYAVNGLDRLDTVISHISRLLGLLPHWPIYDESWAPMTNS